MTMTKTYIVCILWVAVLLDMSDTVNGSQREASKQQQQQQQQQQQSQSQSQTQTQQQQQQPFQQTTAKDAAGQVNMLVSSSSSRSGVEPTDAARTGPYFDLSASKNVTALLGKTAYLNCRVKNLGNKTMLLQVSWVRHRDIHLLTVGRYTYTSDQRFRAIHHPHTEDWSLQIKYPQHRDSGIYECQISTTPPIGHFVYLTVVEPVTEINGGPDLFINKGSTINLTCTVKYAPEPPPAVIWKHNRDDINFDSPRGGISLVTEKGVLTSSRLLVQKAIASDSGLYTCEPSNANPASVRVHILNEHPAAMHHGMSTILAGPSLVVFVLTTLLLYYHHSIRWRHLLT